MMAAFIGLSLITACSKNSEAKEALKALRKIEAATEVGVTYQQYRQLLIEAQAEVNEAKAKLPDGEPKAGLSAVMEMYGAVGDLWGQQIKKDNMDDPKANALKQEGWAMASKKLKEIGKSLGE